MIYQMADTALNPRKTIGELIGRPVQFYMGLTGKRKTPPSRTFARGNRA